MNNTLPASSINNDVSRVYDAKVYLLVDNTLKRGLYKIKSKKFYPKEGHKKDAFFILSGHNLVDFKGYSIKNFYKMPIQTNTEGMKVLAMGGIKSYLKLVNDCKIFGYNLEEKQIEAIDLYKAITESILVQNQNKDYRGMKIMTVSAFIASIIALILSLVQYFKPV